MATPWSKIKAEWLRGGTSYKKLAEKYHVSEKTIQNRSSNEGWRKDKGRIAEEVGKKLCARIVRVREEQLEKLARANEDLIDALVAIATGVKNGPVEMLTDRTGTLRNAESLTKAIQTAIQNQRDLFRLPSMDQQLKKAEFAQRKKEAKEKLALEKAKWEAEQREKAKAAEAASQTVWEVIEPEGDDTDA